MDYLYNSDIISVEKSDIDMNKKRYETYKNLLEVK